jgi:hypothetical protein
MILYVLENFESFEVPFSKIASFKATTCLEIVWLCPEKLTCYIFIRRECGTLTIVGQGAYIGLPKAHNGGENGSPANDTITYIVSSSSETEMTLDIEVGGEL